MFPKLFKFNATRCVVLVAACYEVLFTLKNIGKCLQNLNIIC